MSFGLFECYADDELQENFPLEHSWYQKHLAVEKSDGADGEFWAAMPMGESRAQVADRVKGVFGTILRDADPNRDDQVQNFIIVSNGVTNRAERKSDVSGQSVSVSGEPWGCRNSKTKNKQTHKT